MNLSECIGHDFWNKTMLLSFEMCFGFFHQFEHHKPSGHLVLLYSR